MHAGSTLSPLKWNTGFTEVTMARKPDSHHVLPLFCDDLIASCVDMTPACFGAYMRVLCYAWTRGGVPDDEAACCRITGGMEDGDWAVIRARLIDLGDGRLSHQRLELERQAVAELKAKKAEAGRKGGRPKANGKQTESKTKADTAENGKQKESKTKAPTPTPTPLCIHTHAVDEFRQPGWAAAEWESFVAVWNVTERAAKWNVLSPPDGWIDAAASPGWLQKARQAIERLPRCHYLEKPLAVTQFIKQGWADRIIAGEFDNAKPKHPQRGGRDFADAPAPPREFTGEVAEAFDRTRKKLAAAKEGI
jgi:uncharacterized protein YdaU (DUF1376 family)